MIESECEGTGLDLAVCRRIVESGGGWGIAIPVVVVSEIAHRVVAVPIGRRGGQAARQREEKGEEDASEVLFEARFHKT